MQLASYQLLQKLPSAVRGDVYAREAAGSETLYFLGKVIAEATDALKRTALAPVIYVGTSA